MDKDILIIGLIIFALIFFALGATYADNNFKNDIKIVASSNKTMFLSFYDNEFKLGNKYSYWILPYEKNNTNITFCDK